MLFLAMMICEKGMLVSKFSTIIIFGFLVCVLTSVWKYSTL